jgi:hypothetical protein
MRRAFAKRPWLLVIFAFVALIGAWTVLIIIAEWNKPEEIALPPPVSAKP